MYAVFFAPLMLLTSMMLVSCTPDVPPAERPVVTQDHSTLTGNVVQGKALFDDECGKCHQVMKGHNSKGPQLARIWGAQAGQLADYQSRYSSALINSKLVWNEKNLDAYLKNSKALVPNGKMLYDGLPDATQRQHIIAYLATLK